MEFKVGDPLILIPVAAGTGAFFVLLITGALRRHVSMISVTTAPGEEREGVVALNDQARGWLGIAPGDSIRVRFRDATRTPALILEARRALKKEARMEIAAVSIQDLLHAYGDFHKIPEEVSVDLKVGYVSFLRQSLAAFFSAWFGICVALLSLGFVTKARVPVEVLLYAAALAVFATVARVPSIDLREPWRTAIHSPSVYRRIRKTHREIPGHIPVLLTAPHVTQPGREFLISYITEHAAEKTGAHAILGAVSRAELDLNRAEATGSSFRRQIDRLVASESVRVILDLHGAVDRGDGPDIELGTASGTTAEEHVCDRVRDILVDADFKVEVDQHFRGSASPGNIITSYGRPTAGVHAMQIEISRRCRRRGRREAPAEMVIAGLATAVTALADDIAQSPDESR